MGHFDLVKPFDQREIISALMKSRRVYQCLEQKLGQLPIESNAFDSQYGPRLLEALQGVSDEYRYWFFHLPARMDHFMMDYSDISRPIQVHDCITELHTDLERRRLEEERLARQRLLGVY